MVISPYRRTFTLFKSDIVDKLMNANHSFSNLPYELHCSVQDIQSSLQQTTLANQQLLNQVNIHINESLKSISQLENETKENEILMNELNKTVETAQEDVRLGEIAVEKAQQHSSHVFASSQGYRHGKSYVSGDYGRGGIFGGYNSQHHFRSYRPGTWCNFDVLPNSWYDSRTKAIREAKDKLNEQQQQLKDELVKYDAIESQLRNSSEQITELNTTLQEQQIMKIVTDALNKEFQLIAKRLKPFSTSSKRLIDVLMYILDYQTIVEPLNSIYDKLLNENMIESSDLKLSKEMMDKIKQKLIYLTAKLPQIRYRRKQFHQSCIPQ